MRLGRKNKALNAVESLEALLRTVANYSVTEPPLPLCSTPSFITGRSQLLTRSGEFSNRGHQIPYQLL